MGKRFQFVILLIQTFINRHRKFIILGFMTGFFFTLFLIQLYPFLSVVKGSKEKRIAYIGKFQDNSLPLSIQKLISMGLTDITATGEAAPSVSSSWKISSDGLSYIFTLNTDIYWHDRSKFSSKDINYKLKGVLLEPTDDHTLKVTLNEPYSPLPVALSKPLFKPNLIGLGLYRVTSIKYTGDDIDELKLSPLKEGLSSLNYKFYPNLREAILAFKRGEVNAIESITNTDDLAGWKNIKTTEITLYDRFVGIFFNLRNTNFKEKEVRQALNYAVPKFENVEKAYTPISPLSWAYSSKIRLFKYDPEVAQKILAKNPLSSASSEIIISTYSSHLDTAQIVADAWKKIGLNTKVKVETFFPQDYQVMIMILPIPSDPDQYQYWQSTQDQTNITHYSNLKIDKLLEDGRTTSDQEKRKKIYADFQRYLVDDTPVIFLYHPKVYNVERK